MGDFLKTAVILAALFIGLPVLVLWLRDRVSRTVRERRNPPEKLAADRRAYEERILRPNWEFYERHLARKPPVALRDLYRDRALVTARDLAYTDAERISTFNALDEQQLHDTQLWLGFDAVAIATTDFSDPIYLKPGSSEADTLYITHHDGGDTEVFAESVAVMVERLKQANDAGR